MNKALPLIVHLDADAFFVAVEQALNPALVGKKVAVGGGERGIISSASYEARACGVYTPMASVTALKVCPDLILLPHTSGVYGKYSRQMFDLCETLTPYVERTSIDEGYLDLSPCGLKTLAEVEAKVRGLHRRITEELKISVSFGIASNKLVSQIASKLRKPRGFVIVPVGEEEEFLAPLSVGKLPGVGAKTEAALNAAGIHSVRDVLERSEFELRALFGSGWRDMLASARGVDERPVETSHEDAKSYSEQETFAVDVSDFGEIEAVAKRMVDALMRKIRDDGKRVKTISVKVRYPDFTQDVASQSLEQASDLEAPFYPLMKPLLKKAWGQRRPLRLVSVRFSGVQAAEGQLELFAEGDEKRRRLAQVLDRLNAVSKTSVVQHGHQLGAQHTRRKR